MTYRHGATVVAALVTAVLVIVPRSQGQASCCAPRVVLRNTLTHPDSAPFVDGFVADDIGNLVLMTRRTGGGVTGTGYFFSWDDGETWTWREPLRGVPFGRSQSALLGDGTFVCLQSADAELWVGRSSDAGRTFEPPRRICAIPDTAQHFVGTDGTSRIVAAWIEFGATRRLSCVTSDDAGRTWTGPVVIRASGGMTNPPLILVMGSDILIALREDGRINCYATHDYGSTWVPPTQPDGSDSANPRGFCDAGGGNAVLLFDRPVGVGTTGELLVTTSRDLAASWTPPQLLAAGEWLTLDEPQLTCGGDGRAWILWGNNEEGAFATLPVRRSERWGWPGTWVPTEAAVDAVQPHAGRQEPSDGGFTHLVHDDYRDLDGTIPEKESIYLSRSCDDGRSWPTELRLDVDVPPAMSHSEDAAVVRSASGRVHVAWYETTSAQHVALEPPAAEPRLAHETRPGTCGREEHTFSVLADSVSWCASPTYTWFLDGARVGDASGPTWDLPPETPAGSHQVRVEVDCVDAAPCGNRSISRSLFVRPTPLPPALPREGLLIFVRRVDDDLLILGEDPSPVATDYNTYRGTIARLRAPGPFDHAAARCHEPRLQGSLALAEVLALPSEDSYFLVARATCLEESVPGSDSFAVPHPVVVVGNACGPSP